MITVKNAKFKTVLSHEWSFRQLISDIVYTLRKQISFNIIQYPDVMSSHAVLEFKNLPNTLSECVISGPFMLIHISVYISKGCYISNIWEATQLTPKLCL